MFSKKKTHQWILRDAPDDKWTDRKTVLDAVNENGWELYWAYRKFRNDRDIVLAAVKNNWMAIHLAKPPLNEDKEIFLAAIRQDLGALSCIPKDSGTLKDPDVEEAIKLEKDKYERNKKVEPKPISLPSFYKFFTPKNKFIAGTVMNTAALVATLGAIGFIHSAATAPTLLTATVTAVGGLTISTGGLALALTIAVLSVVGVGLMIKGGYDQYQKNKELKNELESSWLPPLTV